MVVVESANLEQLVELSDHDALAPGGKHSVNLRHHGGGSGLSIARRLLARGCCVLPVLTYGDGIGGSRHRRRGGGMPPSLRSA